jgi:hypothetical protein
MTKTQKINICLAIFCIGVLIGVLISAYWPKVEAQTLPPFELFIDPSQTQAACIVKPGFTAYCQAFEGPMVSVNGTPFVKIPLAATPAGVSSVTVCNAAGASCGAAQTGPVTLNIPKTVTVTISAPLSTATLQ